MARIAIEIRSGTARFAVAVQAHSIQRALDIAAARYPGSVARVKPSIDQDGSSVEYRAA